MKWLFIPAAALSLALATPAFASPPPGAPAGVTKLAQRDRDQRKPRSQTQKPAQRTQPPQRTRQQPQVQQQRRSATMERRQVQQQPRYDWSKYQQRRVPPRLKTRHRFDIQPWQRNFRAEKRYRWHRYQRPSGWYFRRWVFGMVLPTLFWTHDYWITDYWTFGLSNPPYGYVWVRYGDDALLVNVRSGYILQVIYDLFE